MNNQEWSILNQDLTRGEYITFNRAKGYVQIISGRVLLLGQIVVNKFGVIAVVVRPDPVHFNGLSIKGNGFTLIERGR